MRGVLSPLQVVIAAEDSSPGKGMSPGEGEERTGAEIRSHTLPRFSSSSLEGAPSAQGGGLAEGPRLALPPVGGAAGGGSAAASPRSTVQAERRFEAWRS